MVIGVVILGVAPCDDAPPAAVARSGRRHRVLSIVSMLVLRQAGATVTSSGVPSEAVDLIDLQAPDVVITDLHMPKHDGIWLLEKVKARLPGVPVILVSGYIDEPQLGRLRRLGFADVLAKPLPVSELANTVARVVGV